MKPWWQQWRKRLGFELRQLKSAGISYRLDHAAFNNGAGALFLTMEEGPYKGLNLTARFPDIYPYTRFEIFCDEVNLTHHQDPFSKNFCLIGRSSENWHTTDTISKFLTERLPNVMSAGQTSSANAESSQDISFSEEPQGEPFSEYYTYLSRAIVITNSTMVIPSEVQRGYLEIGYEKQNDEADKFFIRRILDENGICLAENEPEYLQEKQSRSLVKGKWVRRESPVVTNNPTEFWKILREENEFLHSTGKTKINEKTLLFMVGVVFPEEYSLRKKQDGWVFLLRKIHMQKGKFVGEEAHLVRAGYAGRSDMAQRVPFFPLLQQKKVAVIGTGCLGGPSILELARCGISEIRMLDHDFLDPGTAVRWPFGITAAGELKVIQLAKHIGDNYPFTKTKFIPHRLGTTSLASKKDVTDIDVLNDLLAGVDLIYDATTELGLQHLFSDLAAAKKIPYIGISTTQGAWGGIVVKICPQSTSGCWNCYRHFIDEHEEVRPSKDENGITQPKGCGDVTYVGAGFDAQQIALEGVRAAVSVLTHGSKDGYPALDWDLSILSSRDNIGAPIPPTWKAIKLTPHPNCQCSQN